MAVGLDQRSLLSSSDLRSYDSVRWLQNMMEEITVRISRDVPGGAVVKNPPANAGDTGSSPGPGRSHMLQSN